MVVQHNMTAMNSNRMLGVTTSAQAKNTEKLSSGYQINRAADDAAGLTISEKMRSQIRGLTQASTNAQDGISCVQTAEGALGEVEDMLQRMNELAIKSANGTNTTDDRFAIQKEVAALCSEIDRVSTSTNFNTKNLLNGSFAADKNVTLQVGAYSGSSVEIKITIKKMNCSSIMGTNSTHGSCMVSVSGSIATFASGKTISGLKSGAMILDVSKASTAKAAIAVITKAIASISSQRSDLGAVQNRLEHTIKNLDNIVENTTAAESTIRDTDMAKMMVEFTKNNILAQAGQSMLAQANQSTQGVMSLLG
ncbi:MAG: flagellin [Lachnospiraceae bacterium]|nr:flagellin [Lachnospiraceae bacterium]